MLPHVLPRLARSVNDGRHRGAAAWPRPMARRCGTFGSRSAAFMPNRPDYAARRARSASSADSGCTSFRPCCLLPLEASAGCSGPSWSCAALASAGWRPHPQYLAPNRLELLGDVVLATPAIRAMRLAYPEAEIVALTTAYTADALRWNPHVSRVVTFDTHRWIPALRSSGARPATSICSASSDDAGRTLRSLHRRFGLLAAVFSFLIGPAAALATVARAIRASSPTRNRLPLCEASA